jgi:hypothetical protein
MKSIISVVAFVTVAIACLAEEPTCSFSSLPPTVYLLTEPIAGSANGASLNYELQRGDKQTVVIFSTVASAEQFLTALGETKGHKRSITPMPKTFAREFEKLGTFLLLDPKTPAEGGTLVVEPKNPQAELDNPEIKTLCDEDQADRTPEKDKAIDWNVVGPRDAKRLVRVKAIYMEGKVNTASDYFHAALVLQHGAGPEDFLLAHEFAIVAVRKGDVANAPWLVAASEDRFLQSINRKQRFGTQLTEQIVVDGCITDRLRAELSVPSLAEEQEQANAFHRK